VLAAAALLRVEAPDWRVRVVHVTDLLVLGIPQKYPLLSTNRASTGCFPFIAHVFKFHGYMAAIKQLLREWPHNDTVRHAGEEPV
jgi:xylulose-5-phosphate/fructose-6-phosphate phosphoketolase